MLVKTQRRKMSIGTGTADTRRLPPHRVLQPILDWAYNSLNRVGLVPTPPFSAQFHYKLRTTFLGLLSHQPLEYPPLREDMNIFANLFTKASDHFRRIVEPFAHEISWPLGRVYNGMFECVDAVLYYCVIRTFRPRSIVEVGSGNSAWIASEALERNGSGTLIAIDPSPRERLPPGVEHIRRQVEDAPLDIFAELSKNDILFLDSSHRMPEVSYHVGRIVPSLAGGVLIHVHDTYFPYDCYHRLDPNRFAETNAWLNQLKDEPDSYDVLTSAPFAFYADMDLVRKLVPASRYRPFSIPKSLWVRKKPAR